MRHLILFVLGLSLASCGSLQERQNKNEYMTLATLWVQNAAEYRALCHQAFNTASRELKRYSTKEISERKMAIVLDLDETVLDNSPYQAMLIHTGENYSEETWTEWIKLKRAQAVPGVRSFLQFAERQGFELFFISNRAVRHFEDTYQNMIELGLPVKRQNMFLRTSQFGKDQRRLPLLEKHQIVMMVGDVMTDFSDDYENKSTNERHILTDRDSAQFGTRYIILPNPMYGEWERALYGHDLRLDSRERAARRLRALYRY